MNTNSTCRRYPHLAAACALLIASSVCAQTPAPNDPFVRDAKAAAPAPGDQAQPSQNVYGLLEYIEVPRDAWLAYSGAHPVSMDATDVRAEVQRWIAAGKAKPIEITCAPTVSGNRTAVESVIEWRYASEFVLALPTSIPKSFETRNTNLIFEWEPILNANSAVIESQMTTQIVNFMGDTPKWSGKVPPGSATQPSFAITKPSVSLVTKPDQPCLVQVSTPFDEQGKPRESVLILLFFRSAPVASAPAQKEPGAKAGEGEAGAPKKTPAAERTLRVFEVERMEVTVADLNLWFAEKPLATATTGLRAAARQWIGAGRGKEIDRRVGPVRSGNRTLWENIYECRYPIGYTIEGYMPEGPTKRPETVAEQIQLLSALRQTPNKALDRPVIAPNNFETRNTGLTIEVEPVGLPDARHVQAQIVVTDDRICGSQVLHRREVGDESVPDMEQPIFNRMRAMANIALALGEPRLFSITTPANDQKKADPERRILTFVTVRN